jgi:hypothetical protein
MDYTVAHGNTVYAKFGTTANVLNITVDITGTGTVDVTGNSGYRETVAGKKMLAVPVSAGTTMTFKASVTGANNFTGFGHNDLSAPDRQSPTDYNISHNDTIYAVFEPDASNFINITVNIAGTGAVEVSGTAYTETITRTVLLAVPVSAGILTFEAFEIGVYTFAGFGQNDRGAPDGSPVDYTISREDVVYVVFTSDKPDSDSAYYLITSSATPGANISPLGKISVQRGESQTFLFSAEEQHMLTVIVDGTRLTQEQAAAGSYTFRDVSSNHTISASTEDYRDSIFLKVKIVEGKGRVEYSVNGSPFAVYVSEVILPLNANVELIAYAADGYTFKEWHSSAGGRETSSEISLRSVTASVSMEVRFSGSSSDDVLLYVAILVTAAVVFLLLLFFLFYRRSYEVVKVGGNIIGEDKARRKTAYTFTAKGPGTVSYKVGENGQWKTLAAGPNGMHTIPKEDVVDKLMIEQR